MTNLSLRLKVSDKGDFLPSAWRNNSITLLNFPEDILETRGRVGFQTYSRALKRKKSENIDYDVMWHSILFVFEWFWFHKETIKGYLFYGLCLFKWVYGTCLRNIHLTNRSCRKSLIIFAFKDFWTLWKSMQAAHLKEKMSKESSKKKKQKEGRKRRIVSQSASSSLRRRLPPRPRTARR